MCNRNVSQPHGLHLGRERSGFTLIELLVVIAIIAILAAILFPVFARARENARRSSCQSNEKNIALSIMQYTQDYDERLPSHWTDGGLYEGTKLQWVNTLQPYVKNFQVFFCPSSSKNSGAAVSSANIAYGYNWQNLNIQSLAAVTYPSETLLIGDTGLNPTAYVMTRTDATRSPNDIHLEGCNFAFVDGHVKWMKARPVIALTPTNLWDLN